MARAFFAALTLLIAGGWAFLMLTMETCTMAAADSLSMGVIIIVLNIVGFVLLGSVRLAPNAVLRLTLPAILAAAFYSFFTIRFVSAWTGSGISSCEALTGLPFEEDGREAKHVAIWIGATLSFWVGLTYVIARAAKRTGRP